ncbi:asparagine synthase (glutamine-hydrolyzing) [Chitinophagaceae bacterium OAS944]|nr:asparagine synthase (glutamine-hydrolyzing) [Chitinophagaceae bacterium OAS944]
MNMSRVQKENDPAIIQRMTRTLTHRGPDDMAVLNEHPVTFGFTRLSIIDLSGGRQPLTNEDDSLVLICNGEIFNYIELREELVKKGHQFKTRTDVEVLLHLYEEYGTMFLNKLNGQFAFVIYDKKKQLLFCARDHFGIIPFFYTVANGTFIFGSEIKAILEHPAVKKELDLTGLDQVFTFPGLVSPRTMFKDIKSLENGHYLIVEASGKITNTEYWDLIYTEAENYHDGRPDEWYIDQLNDLIDQSIRLRLRSDVPVGCYLSGGLDSSLIAAKLKQLTPDIKRNTFSIDFSDPGASESAYQRTMAGHIQSTHFEKLFVEEDVIELLPKAIYHCECPLKESYNTASLALSKLVRDNNIKVILTGEGADELFAGYVGYKFDHLRKLMNGNAAPVTKEERAVRAQLWGDEHFFYEKNYSEFTGQKKLVYSADINERYADIDCLNHFVIDREKIRRRDVLHQRSYVDYKLRMVDHLVSDHGDRMAMGNSVEARYPFLDKNIAEFAAKIPARLKLNDLTEKYILRRIAADLLPEKILKREKFGFIAPPSTQLLKKNKAYVNDMLSHSLISRQNYFNANAVEKLKKDYMEEGFKLNIPFDSDLLITVLTFNIFLEQFGLDR